LNVTIADRIQAALFVISVTKMEIMKIIRSSLRKLSEDAVIAEMVRLGKKRDSAKITAEKR
jgi:hypothetical protein